MSLDLCDLKRLKITAETRAWLSAEALRSGDSPQEIVRDALHALALDRIAGAKLLVSLAPGEGHARDGSGPVRDGRGRGR